MQQSPSPRVFCSFQTYVTDQRDHKNEIALKSITFSKLPFSKYRRRRFNSSVTNDHCEGTLRITAHRRSILPRSKRWGVARYPEVHIGRRDSCLHVDAITFTIPVSRNSWMISEREPPPRTVTRTKIFHILSQAMRKTDRLSFSVLVLSGSREETLSREQRNLPDLTYPPCFPRNIADCTNRTGQPDSPVTRRARIHSRADPGPLLT